MASSKKFDVSAPVFYMLTITIVMTVCLIAQRLHQIVDAIDRNTEAVNNCSTR